MGKRTLLLSLLLLNAIWVCTFLGVVDLMPLGGSGGETTKELPVGDRFEKEFFGRSILVRLRNQLHYSLFDEIHTKNVIQGPTGLLYEENYLRAAQGADAMSIGEIAARMSFLKSVVRSTQAEHRLVLAPGKAAVVDTSLWPEAYRKARGKGYNANYLSIKQWLKQGDSIEVLDYMERFMESDPEELLSFPTNGIHWSQFSIALILHEWLEDLPGIHSEILDTIPCAPYGTDEDIERSMNVLLNLQDAQSFKLVTQVQREGNPPRILIIGDSFAWGFVNDNLLKLAGDSSEFWYYNRQRYGPSIINKGESVFESLGIQDFESFCEAVGKFDRVYWVVTDANLSMFPFQAEKIGLDLFTDTELAEDIGQ